MIYPLDTGKQLVPQKNDVKSFYQLALFSSGAIGNRHMGPDQENRVDVARQLYVFQKLRYNDNLKWKSIIMEKLNILMSILRPTFLKTGLESFQHFIPVEQSSNTFTLWQSDLDCRPINYNEDCIHNLPYTHCTSDKTRSFGRFRGPKVSRTFLCGSKEYIQISSPVTMLDFFLSNFGYRFNIFFA